MNLVKILGLGFVALAGVGVAPVAQAAAPAVSCDGLAKFALPGATVTSATTVEEGGFVAAGRDPNFFYAYNLTGRGTQGTNPAFCRVVALKPSSDSDIRVEIWLPQDWNGKFLGIGSFGWGGSINYAGLLSGLQDGYAVANNDTGHQDDGGQFAVGHPEKLIDYAYRANHEMTVDAKAVVNAFYGADPAKSYWAGCSLGGLQGLIEAKRYPDDYNAMIVGAPPNPIVDFNALQIWPSWLINRDPARLIPEAKYTMIHNAVVAQCGTAVGKNDNLVDEPKKCTFDPNSLRCRTVDAPDCLTTAQVDLLTQEYAGPKNPRTGRTIFPGPAKGAELTMFADVEPMGVALDLFRYPAFEDASWDFKSMDWDKVLKAAEDKLGPLLHVDADLTPFFARDGKILFYIGWNDTHNPLQLADYIGQVKNSSGAKAADAIRMFAIPGMGHCGGGEGCDTFNRLSAMDNWVEKGEAPERILAMKIVDGDVVRSRPICAYPAVARYDGKGDINDATNFTCGGD